MTIRKCNNETAALFIKETINLIEEKGGSSNVNLREIAKRVGCAHTNAYNYFDGFDGLMWAAFEEVLNLYGNAMVKGLNNKISGHKYLTRLIKNLADFGINNPGLYRLIASDPLEQKSVPGHVIESVSKMKQYFIDVVYILSKDRLSRKEAYNAADIILAYMDGEIFNLINGRYLPEENISSRILKNVEMIFTLLTSKTSDGIVLKRNASKPGILSFPVLDI